jgi:type II secretory pathway pseudopilin PulG
MELLLVAAILAIISLIAVPAFVRSTRGNRLRTAARTVVASGRYARSMALMRQAPVGVTFDLNAGRIVIREAGTSTRTADEDAAAVRETPTGPGAPPPEERGDTLAAVERILDRVRLARVEPAEGDAVLEGRYTVIYGTNGRCLPYTVTVEDARGAALQVEVDALASARVSGPRGELQ